MNVVTDLWSIVNNECCLPAEHHMLSSMVEHACKMKAYCAELLHMRSAWAKAASVGPLACKLHLYCAASVYAHVSQAVS